jgi:hypothetical protein
MLDCLAGNVPAAGDKVDTIDVTLIPRASTAAPKP